MKNYEKIAKKHKKSSQPNLFTGSVGNRLVTLPGIEPGIEP